MDYDYVVYMVRCDGFDTTPVTPITLEELQPIVAADRDLAWVSQDEPGANSVPDARGYRIAYKGEDCIEGNGLTLGACADENLVKKMIRIADALGASLFENDKRLSLKKGMFGGLSIVATGP